MKVLGPHIWLLNPDFPMERHQDGTRKWNDPPDPAFDPMGTRHTLTWNSRTPWPCLTLIIFFLHVMYCMDSIKISAITATPKKLYSNPAPYKMI